jgi:hypothetical protein
MPTPRDRRSFLRRALPDAVREVGRARQAFERELDGVGDQAPGAAGQRPWASAAARCCSRDQLAALAVQHGLEDRADAVLELSALSYRLCPSTAGSRGAFARATASGTEVRAALDLRSLGAVRLAPDRPPGFLLVGASFEDGEEVARASVGYEESRSREPSAVCGRAVTGSAERVLPRAWAAAVEELGLEPEEQLAWNELRASLARSQGVTPVDGTEQTHRLHRLLGFPDERTGTIPLACERFRPGASADERRWTLLLQVTAAAAGSDLLVTIWGDRGRLAEGDLRGLVAVRRPVG